MRTLRAKLRKYYVAPFAIALLALWPIEMLLIASESYVSEGAASTINWIGRHASHSYIGIQVQSTLVGKFYLAELGISIAAFFGVWLVALWFYPESLRDEAPTQA
jgi:hypothetical protein